MKPPALFHSREYQNQLLGRGSRDQIIEWLVWNDPNGVYADSDSIAEDRQPLTIEQAQSLMRELLQRDSGELAIRR